MRFVFVNHVTTNPFFVPTRYGAEDACELLGCSYQWTGSESANVNEMVNALNSAISAKVDGIAVAIVDLKAFNDADQARARRRHPGRRLQRRRRRNDRLAYIGQDLFVSGQEMGKRIVELVGEGDVALFIATPGSLNIQPRIDGAIDAIKKSGAPIKYDVIATGAALPKELSTVDAYYVGHKDVKGMFAVDAGSTQAVAQVIQKYKLREKGVKGGGYDLLEPTMELLAGRPARLHDRPAAVPAGLLSRCSSCSSTRRRRRSRAWPRSTPGLKFLDQGDGGALRDDQVALRGQLRDGRRHRVLGMPAETVIDEAARAPARPREPRDRAAGSGAPGLGRRLLTLREGSVIVITVLVAAYFAATTEAFLTWDNFKTLLPYFAPFAILAAGEVILMINGEIDLSIGAVYLFAPFMFHEFHVAGVPLLAALRAGAGDVRPGRPGERVLHDRDRHQLVHHDARDAARADRLHADHLRRAARVDARNGRARRGDGVRDGLRRRHLLRADLGARDRARAAAGAQPHALGDLHRGRGEQPARRRRGRHQGPPGHHPQLRRLRRSAPVWSACWRRCARPRSSPIRPEPTRCCSAASRRR